MAQIITKEYLANIQKGIDAELKVNIKRVLEVKNGEVLPDRCDACDCYRHNWVLKAPISILDLVQGI